MASCIFLWYFHESSQTILFLPGDFPLIFLVLFFPPACIMQRQGKYLCKNNYQKKKKAKVVKQNPFYKPVISVTLHIKHFPVGITSLRNIYLHKVSIISCQPPDTKAGQVDLSQVYNFRCLLTPE